MRWLLCSLFAAMLASPSPQPVLRVHAAASLADVLQPIARRFEQESGARVVMNFGASSTLARQIEEGVPGDIFFSADEAKMDRLTQRELVEEKTRRSFLSNELVIVVPATDHDRFSSAHDLVDPRFRRIALADPRTVPAGVYAREYLTRAHLWHSLARRIIPTANVRAALMAVERGDADAGIVYASDVRGHAVRTVMRIEGALASPISYPVAVLAESQHKALALRFIEFLQRPASRAQFIQRGFRWK